MSEEPDDEPTEDATDGSSEGTDGELVENTVAAQLDSQDATPAEDVLAAGLSPLLSLGSQAAGALGLPEPTVLADDVLSRPPEDRFRSSASRYADRFDVPLLAADGLSDAGDDLPVDDPFVTAVETVVRNAGRWQGQLLAQLVYEPDDPDPYLALAVLLERLERAAVGAKAAHETGSDTEHLLSTGLAVLARLVSLVETDATVDDDTYRDAVLASYHVEVATGGEPRFDPAERTDPECRRIVRLQGALLAFDTFDRPADEVAALTGVGPEAILAAIGRRDTADSSP
ncbi:hypothetical protein [Haloarchaeobius litoreus]|uniref:Uncharacterized protein n=1 Tax=Haloarchaeobius litoreus TaxID=755306 RepID=A0ABD6DIX0_9EURY|nr:hypothetical protein [Haloarchaeobius litoreus]